MSCSNTSRSHSISHLTDTCPVDTVPISPLSRAEIPPPCLYMSSPGTGYAATGPHYSAMRDKRNKTMPKVSQLPRISEDTSVISKKDLWDEVLEVYSYDRLVDDLYALQRSAMNAFHALVDHLPAIHIGPRGCAAAAAASNSEIREFIHQFESEADSWVSPAARTATDTSGLLVVITYHYYEKSSEELNKRIMQKFQIARGDRFFLEGLDPGACMDHDLAYELPDYTCRMLEKDSALVSRFVRLIKQVNMRVRKQVNYVSHHVPGAPPAPPLDEDREGIRAYIRRWASQLPVWAKDEYQKLQRKSIEAIKNFDKMSVETIAMRGQYMADVLKRDKGPGWNFVIAGAGHIPVLREQLALLPCVFVAPKKAVASNASVAQNATAKEEL